MPATKNEGMAEGQERNCLWIDEKDLLSARSITFIVGRLKECSAYRNTAGRDAKKMLINRIVLL